MANLSEEERLAAHRAFVRLEEWFRAVEMQHDRCLGRPVGRPGIDVPEEVNREEW